MSALAFTAFFASIIIVACVADAFLWNRKAQQTLYRFFLVEGKLRLPFYTTALVAANLSVGNFIVFISVWGYKYGLAGLLCFIVNLALNVLGFAIFFPRFRGYIESHENNGTIHDYLSTAYTPDPRSRQALSIRLTASVVTIVGLTLAIVFELSLAVQLLRPANEVQGIAFFSGFAVIIALFTAYGGFRTLVTSDLANATILTFSVAVMCVLIRYMWVNTAAAPPLSFDIHTSDFANLGWPNMLSIAVIGFGWMLVAMDQWQRTCASRSLMTAIEGLLIYLPVVSLFAIAFAAWGVFDHNVLPLIVSEATRNGLSGDQNPLLDLTLLPVDSTVGRYLVAFIISGLVFAAISTTNTFLNVCSHSFTSDILVGSIANRALSKLTPAENTLYVAIARTIIVGMVVIIILCFAGLTIGGLLKDPLSFFFIAYSVQFALLPAMTMSALPRRLKPSSLSALASICVGFATSLVVGFGSWLLMQAGDIPVFRVAPSDWLTLAPVVTIGFGFLPLLPSSIGRWKSAPSLVGTQ
jgi:Na+/proline symporter